MTLPVVPRSGPGAGSTSTQWLGRIFQSGTSRGELQSDVRTAGPARPQDDGKSRCRGKEGFSCRCGSPVHSVQYVSRYFTMLRCMGCLVGSHRLGAGLVVALMMSACPSGGGDSPGGGNGNRPPGNGDVRDVLAANLSLGFYHSCAISTVGSLYCWGDNTNGELGIGNPALPNRTSPTLVNDSALYAQVSGGLVHNCGVLLNGTLKCWGGSGSGHLGKGLAFGPDSHSPEYVIDNSLYVQVASGTTYSCGVLQNGSLKCWGANTDGQLGIPGGVGRVAIPTFVNDSSLYTQVAGAEFHSCGILQNGSLKCWGNKEDGKVGDGGSTGFAGSPVFVNDTSPYLQISIGRFHSCGVLQNGSLKCWGSGRDGRLGVGGPVPPMQASPLFVNDSSLYAQVSAGHDHTCGVLRNGSVKCWGDGADGRLGTGASDDQASPTHVNDSSLYTMVSVYTHTCGILRNGTTKCWGSGADGRLGVGAPVPVNLTSPTIVEFPRR